MATQDFGGKPCNIGTRNWRHPDQWPMSNIMEMRLKILMKTEAMFRNCREESVTLLADDHLIYITSSNYTYFN